MSSDESVNAADESRPNEPPPPPAAPADAVPPPGATPELSPEDLRAVADEIAAAPPPPRNGTEVTLLEVDPFRCHAYWHVEVEDYDIARAAVGAEAIMVLRVHDLSPPAGESFDLEIQGLEGHATIDLWRPGRAYEALLGFRLTDGSLAIMARSNAVQTPPAGEPAPLASVEVLVADTPAAAAGEESAVASPGVAGEEFPLAPWPETPAAVEPAEPASPAPAPAPASAPAPTPVPPARPTVPESSAQIAEEVHRLYATLSPAESAIGAADDAGLAGIECVPPPAKPIELEHHLRFSSGENGRRHVELEVNAEIHLFGRTRPGAELTLAGQKVPIRPDGTFSIRRPLPQGAIVLPLLVTRKPDED